MAHVASPWKSNLDKAVGIGTNNLNRAVGLTIARRLQLLHGCSLTSWTNHTFLVTTSDTIWFEKASGKTV